MDRLRDRLNAVDFTVEVVGGLLGAEAQRALARNETTPAERATRDGSPLSTLVRVFQLQRAEPRVAVDAALPGLVDELVAAEVLTLDGSEVRASVDLRPYGDESFDGWVVCDLTPGLDQAPIEVGPEHVLGISEASSSLARLVVRQPVGSALDLGTGCGVQSLHLARHAGRVVATDVNPRALWAAGLTARLNGIALDVRRGSLWQPVAGERFDLIATNPPFVVSPPSAERLVYRETDLPGDDVVRQVVAGAADHLVPDGWCQVLGSWMQRRDEPWEDRVGGWVEPTGLDAWVVRREVVDPAAYVEMWLADAGLRHTAAYTARYDAWLSWFDELGVEAMIFGWISLRAAGRDVPVTRVETWQHDVVGPMGPAVDAWGRRRDRLAATADVLDVAWRRAEHVTQETFGPPGEPDPEAIVLRLGLGPARARQVDTVEAGLVGALDGDLTAGQALDAIAQIVGREAAELRTLYAPVVLDLVDEGFLS